MTESTHEVALLEAHRQHDSPSLYAPAASSENDKNSSKSKSSQSMEAVKDLAFGSTAGMVGKVIEYPFDTVKVRLQSSTRYSGPLDCFKQSYKSEGVSGLYRGISAPLLGAAIETSSLFFSYRLAQEAIKKTVYRDSDTAEPLPLSTLLVCGAVSGAFTSLLLTPIELVKCQLQVPSNALGHSGPVKLIQRSPLTVIASVYRHGGISGFWHGQLGTLIRETGGSASWFGSYEGVTAFFRKYLNDSNLDGELPGGKATSLPIWQQMIAGACAGVSYNFIFYPADTIKSRMQTEQVEGSAAGQRASFWSAGKLLWREQGVKGMYRGCGITVARAAPSSAFIFTINESLRNMFT